MKLAGNRFGLLPALVVRYLVAGGAAGLLELAGLLVEELLVAEPVAGGVFLAWRLTGFGLLGVAGAEVAGFEGVAGTGVAGVFCAAIRVAAAKMVKIKGFILCLLLSFSG